MSSRSPQNSLGGRRRDGPDRPRRQRPGGRRREEHSSTRKLNHFSRSMTYILRHGAKEHGVGMDERGFVKVAVLLQWGPIQRDGWQEEDVRQVVRDCPKQRFALEEREDGVYIRANQGHSPMENVSIEMEELSLEQLLQMDVIHGTYANLWHLISVEGLKRMGRQHVHFANSFDRQKVISGARSSANLLIFVDAAAASRDGMRWFRSSNGVILTEGFDGVVPPRFFIRAMERGTGKDLLTVQ